MRPELSCRRLLLPLAWLLLLTPPAWGHSFEYTPVELRIFPDDTFQVDLSCDLDALALGAPPGEDSALLAETLHQMPPEQLAERVDRLRRYFERRVRLKVDGEAVDFAVSFPQQADSPELHASPAAAGQGRTGPDEPAPSLLGLTARLEGSLPPEAVEVSFWASSSFPPVILHVIEEPTGHEVREWLGRGMPSPAFVLGQAPPPPSGWEVVTDYLALGFLHIVPKGLDHILFVLGLFLLGSRLAPLLWQVTAFTAAHTVTLALSTLGVVSLSPAIVEPLIALSIAYVAIENLLTRELKPWRPAVVFLFGLLHGLGFAGVLAELGLPDGQLVPALISFNVGVELGQLAVIALAFLAVGWMRRDPSYRGWVVIPASLVIAAIGLFWTVQRIFFSG